MMQDSPLKVLLVEDNPTDALLVEVAFEETAAGADLTHVTCASDALQALSEREFDIVLLDLGLPDSNGLDSVATLNRAAPRTPIIALTGLCDSRLAIEALQIGASDYLIKGQAEGPLLERATRYAIERKRNENSRIALVREQAARQQAEANNRAKDEFLATLSHELRTPLNAILGWASLMRAGGLNAEVMEQAIETIERNARAQTQLIDDLLDVSRIVTGNLRLNSNLLDFNRLVQSVIDGLTPALTAKNLDLQTDLPPVAPICADATRLQQIVWNLVSNAIKFTPEAGRIDIGVSLVATAEDEEKSVGQWLQLSISDNGQGIAPEFMPYVFDRFRQADGSTTRRHGGLGLGLAIVRNLVQLHEGTVEVESAGSGQGATFRVRLPITPAQKVAGGDSPSSTKDDATEARNESVMPLQGVKVLGIDDQFDARRLLQMVLVAHGAQVQMADCALGALEILHIWRPDIVVSDVGMPDIDGYELLRRLRALPDSSIAATPAIALTGYARREERDRVGHAGFQGFLSKPVQADRLVETILKLVERD